MKMYSYIVKNDRGLAPNPFGGYCTMALCTLNHMGIKVGIDDFLMGVTASIRKNRLLYFMKITELMSFDEYYRDSRFEPKKPSEDNFWKNQVGDNMFFIGGDNKWYQHKSLYHKDLPNIQKDLKHPTVFISDKFYYFGDRAIEIPEEFKVLIWPRQGCNCSHDQEIVEQFVKWLSTNYAIGIHGKPLDTWDNAKYIEAYTSIQEERNWKRERNY